jgi:DNA-binding transcriptional LysR family regulator
MQRAMEYILKIYRKQSFSKAAAELFITQPALSAIVKKEEQAYGVAFFNRSVKPIVPTEAGMKYIEAALKIEKIEQALRHNLRSFSNTLTIGSSAFFCSNVLPALVQDFQKETHNQYKIQVLEGSAAELVALLHDGNADFLLSVDHGYGKEFKHEFMKKEYIVLAVPKSMVEDDAIAEKALPVTADDDDYAKAQGISLAAFNHEPFILLSKGNDLYTRAHKMLRKAGVHPSRIIYMDQMQSAFLAANTGTGIAFIRQDMMQIFDQSPHLLFFKIDDTLAQRDVNLFYRRTKTLSPAAQEFLDFCKSYF